MVPNLWGSLLLTAILAGPAAASAQRPVDVGAMRSRADSVQRVKGDSAKPAQPAASAAVAAEATAPAAKPAGSRSATVAVAAQPTAPAGKPAAATPAVPAADSASVDSLNDPTQAQVLRESFTYAGATRDPFASLIKSARGGPELADLQLVGIYEDLHYSGNSVAVLREKGNNGKRHKLRAGDQLGRLRVAQVRSKDVVFTISDFGYERQETLSLRKQEDVTP